MSMIQLVSLISLLLQCSMSTLARPASSSREVDFNDDNEAEWYQHWSNQAGEYHQSSDLEGDFNRCSIHTDTHEYITISPSLQEYQVTLDADRYWQKHQEALANDDPERASKNEKKYRLLAHGNVKGIKALIRKYQRESEDLAAEIVNHQCNAECAQISSNRWERLACALQRNEYEPLGMPVDPSMSAAEVQETREELYQRAQREGTRLISDSGLSSEFNLLYSEKDLTGKRARYRSTRDLQSKRKLDKATKLHNHRINALLCRNADDANALALHYGEKADKHNEAIEKKEMMDEEVAVRRQAWRDKVNELEGHSNEQRSSGWQG